MNLEAYEPENKNLLSSRLFLLLCIFTLIINPFLVLTYEEEIKPANKTLLKNSENTKLVDKGFDEVIKNTLNEKEVTIPIENTTNKFENKKKLIEY